METLLGGTACVLIAIFFLFQKSDGKIRLTTRAGCYMWLLLFAGLSFIWDGLTK